MQEKEIFRKTIPVENLPPPVNIQIDPKNKAIILEGKEHNIRNTPHLYTWTVLTLFAEHPQELVSTEDIKRLLYNAGYTGKPERVSSFVGNLREILSDDRKNPQTIIGLPAREPKEYFLNAHVEWVNADKKDISPTLVNAIPFETLYEKYWNRVKWYLLNRVRNETLAEDLAQDVFQNALGAWQNFKSNGNPYAEEAWVFKIAHNLFVDHYRKDKGNVETSLEERLNWEDYLGDFQATYVASDPQRQIELNAEIELLENSLSQLTEYQRTILLLVGEGENAKSIKKIIGATSEGAVREAISHARKRLRALMKDAELL